MVDPSYVDMLLGPAIAAAAILSLLAAARVCWKDWRALKELKERERALALVAPKKKPLVLPDSEDTRLAIYAARRAKAEFDRVEHLHDILAKQRYGEY